LDLYAFFLVFLLKYYVAFLPTFVEFSVNQVTVEHGLTKRRESRKYGWV